MALWSNLNRMIWVLELKGIPPIARLLGIFIADRCDFADNTIDIWSMESDPKLKADVRMAAEWIGCSEEDVADAASELTNHGLRLSGVDSGYIWFRFPFEPPANKNVADEKQAERWISIYVMSAGQATKIGISISPSSRLAGLQSANPLTRLALEFEAAGPSSKIRRIEREAHQRLSEHALGNEWFSVSTATAVALVRELLGVHDQ